MRRMLLIFLLILDASVMAQERKVRPLRVVRVSIVAQGEENAPLRKALVKELQKLRNIALVTANADFGVQLAGAPLRGDCKGVIVAVLTATPDGHDLQVMAGPNWQEVARYLAARIKEDVNREK